MCASLDGGEKSQAVREYRRLTEEVYLRWKPDSLSQVALLFKKYEGQEENVYAKVVEKYVFSQGRQYWEPLIKGMYARFNPTKLQDMEQVLEKYCNHEAELYKALCAKYFPNLAIGDAPLLLHSWMDDPAMQQKRLRKLPQPAHKKRPQTAPMPMSPPSYSPPSPLSPPERLRLHERAADQHSLMRRPRVKLKTRHEAAVANATDVARAADGLARRLQPRTRSGRSENDPGAARGDRGPPAEMEGRRECTSELRMEIGHRSRRRSHAANVPRAENGPDLTSAEGRRRGRHEISASTRGALVEPGNGTLPLGNPPGHFAADDGDRGLRKAKRRRSVSDGSNVPDVVDLDVRSTAAHSMLRAFAAAVPVPTLPSRSSSLPTMQLSAELEFMGQRLGPFELSGASTLGEVARWFAAADAANCTTTPGV